MALSKQDKEFYEAKLGLNSFGYVFGGTVLVGATVFPLFFYVLDWSSNNTSKWSSSVVIDLATMGFFIGSVIAIVLYLMFKFLLEMGWLPKRH